LTGAPISAERAWQLGLVNHVVAAEELDRRVDSLCASILAVSPVAVRIGKAAFYALKGLDEETAYYRAVEVITANAREHDAQEGITAFLQKRPPAWESP
jgi:enoyl-CoA hydratase/carnithine racemase